MPGLPKPRVIWGTAWRHARCCCKTPRSRATAPQEQTNITTGAQPKYPHMCSLSLHTGVLTTICWVSVVKSTGLTPLEPGMWPKFLALYAALYLTAGTITRPLRLTFAIAAAPAVERALASLQRITGLNKPTAYGLVLLAISAGSIVFFISSIALFGGFPYGLPNVSQLFAAKG